MSALGAFIGDLSSAFKPPAAEFVALTSISASTDIRSRSFEPKTKREPANVSQKAVSSRGLLGKLHHLCCALKMLRLRARLASLDEQAFRRLPEVGAAPDMIDDDLPTNPDYLDEHFGAAAGLRELSDDEFDESDPDSPSVVPDVETPAGVTSAFGGETIRMLRPDGIHVVENYFDTLPPDPGEAARYVAVFLYACAAF